ncbi:MAG: hypothetical protein RSB20_00080 [Clostridia bacterium]
MKGCVGSVFSFFFGIVVGIVLLVGTVAGTGYFMVTQVTVQKAEEMSGQIIFKDPEASIKLMTIMDIINYVKSGKINNITMEEVDNLTGIDLIDVIEKSLNITIDDGPEKDELLKLPVLKVFEGSNLGIVLNSVTLDNILTKMNIDKTTLNMPLIADHLNEPAIIALNAVLGELDFNKLTFADIQYKLGLTLDASILDNFDNFKITEMGSAIETLALESVIPNFDRDFYLKIDDDEFLHVVEFREIEFIEAYTAIASGEVVAEGERYAYSEEYDRYTKDIKGTYKKAKVGSLDLFKREGSAAPYKYVQDKYGKYTPKNVKSNDRYSFDATAKKYVKDKAGTYFLYDNFIEVSKATVSQLGNFPTRFVPKYVSRVDTITTGTGVSAVTSYELQQRGFIEKECVADSLGYTEYRFINGIWERNTGDGVNVMWKPARTFEIQVTGSGTGISHKLLEVAGGDYSQVHIGKTERILKTLADSSVSTMNTTIATLMISDVMDVDFDEYAVEDNEKKLDVDWLSSKVDVRLPDGKVVSSKASDEAFVLIDDLYYHFDKNNPKHLDAKVKLLRRTYKSNTNAAIKQLARVNITQLGAKMTGVVESLAVGDLLAIHYDYYESAGGGFVNTGTAQAPVWTAYNETAHAGMKRYAEPSSKLLQRIGRVAIQNMATEIDKVQLNEIINIESENTYIEVTDINTLTKKDYGVIAIVDADKVEETFRGTFETLTYVDVTDEDNDGNVTEKRSKILASFKAGGKYVSGQPFYRVKKERSSGALVGMANVTIGGLSQNMQTTINKMNLKDVLNIEGDIYEKTAATSYNDAVLLLGEGNVYALVENIFKLNDGKLKDDANQPLVITEFYKKLYNGSAHIILKKLCNIPVKEMGASMDTVITDTTLGEIITINLENEFVLDAAGSYRKLATVDTKEIAREKYKGTYELWSTNGKVNIMVKYQAGYVGDRYSIVAGKQRSSGVLVALEGITVGSLGQQMQSKIDNTKLFDVIYIDGDVYTQFTYDNDGNAATPEIACPDFSTAFVEADKLIVDGAAPIYIDKDGIFASTNGYFKHEAGYNWEPTEVWVKDGNTYIQYNDATHQGKQRFIKADDYIKRIPNYTGYYNKVYTGNDNAIMKKLATISAQHMASRLSDVVNDTSLGELKVGGTGGILGNPRIQNAKIGELPETITDVLTRATLNELNEWGNLGIDPKVILALNISVAIKNGEDPAKYKPTSISDATYNSKYDIQLVDFFKCIVYDSTNPLNPIKFDLSKLAAKP